MNAIRKDVLYKKVREAAYLQWDPVGILDDSDEIDDADEYDGYIPALCELLLKDDVTCRQVFDYLWTVETDSMGLSGDRQNTEDFSAWLCELAKQNA